MPLCWESQLLLREWLGPSDLQLEQTIGAPTNRQMWTEPAEKIVGCWADVVALKQ